MLFRSKLALGNDRGLILNGLVEFSTEGATTFYWSLTVASGLFVAFGSLALLAGLTTKKEVVLTETEIIAPKNGVSRKLVSVAFSEIGDVNVLSVQGQRFLNVLHQGGKLVIPRNMLADDHAFEELTSLIVARVGG